MADLLFIKVRGQLVPYGDDAHEWIKKRSDGAIIRANVRTMRNPEFHRKFFAMLRVAYDNWPHPEINTPFGPATCPFPKFVHDVKIMAGFGEPVANVRGEWRMRAKSIAFHNMSEEEFEEVYKAVRDVLVQRFLSWSFDELDRAVEASLTRTAEQISEF